MITDISDEAFNLIRGYVAKHAGIHLDQNKKLLMVNRLGSRVLQLKLPDYLSYYHYLNSDEGTQSGESQRCIDLITTNETYFYREPKQFQHFLDWMNQYTVHTRSLDIWSAASSTGEECYTLSMLLMERFGTTKRWSILGTDISERVLEQAKKGIYLKVKSNNLCQTLKNKYLMYGTGTQADKVAVVPELRRKVTFRKYNLLDSNTQFGTLFDVIFCRNVMIYFKDSTKQTVVNNLLSKLKPDGLLYVGLSESLRGVHYGGLTQVGPSVYQKRVE